MYCLLSNISQPRTRSAPLSHRQTLLINADLGRCARFVLLFGMVSAVLFVYLDYYVHYGRVVGISALGDLCNMTREDSLASWFQVTQTLCTACTLWMIYGSCTDDKRWRSPRRGWCVLACFFSFMAVDDGVLLHERIGTAVQALMVQAGRCVDCFPSYWWQLALLPLFAALGLFTFCFLWREPGNRYSRMLVSMALCLFALAVGLDFLEGLDAGHRWNLYAMFADNDAVRTFTLRRFARPAFDTLVHFSKSIEECLELMGMSMFFALFLRHLGAVVIMVPKTAGGSWRPPRHSSP